MKLYLLGLILVVLEKTVLFKYFPLDITVIAVILMALREDLKKGLQFSLFVGVLQSIFTLSPLFLFEKIILSLTANLLKKHFFGNVFLLKVAVVLALSLIDVLFWQLVYLYHYQKLDFSWSYLIFLLFNLVVFSIVYVFDRKFQL